MAEDRVMAILAEAKRLAQEYRAVTGKPLGITGEVAEFEAARILGRGALGVSKFTSIGRLRWRKP